MRTMILNEFREIKITALRAIVLSQSRHCGHKETPRAACSVKALDAEGVEVAVEALEHRRRRPDIELGSHVVHELFPRGVVARIIA